MNRKAGMFPRVILAAALMAMLPVLGAGAAEQGKTPDQVVDEIRVAQGLQKGQDIQCPQVTDAQLEELGEAVMDVMHPNQDVHAWMDRMLGGQGSQSLALMHRNLGARYLGCWGQAKAGTWGPGMMMGPGMMTGPGMMGNWNGSGADPRAWHWNRKGGWLPMMNWGYGGMMGYGLGGWIMWIIFIAVIVLIVYLLVVQGRSRGAGGGDSAVEILKRRYARGEISRDEFEKMKKDLSA